MENIKNTNNIIPILVTLPLRQAAIPLSATRGQRSAIFKDGKVVYC